MTKWRSFIDPSVGDGQNTINGIIANGPTYGIGISDDLSVTGLSTFSDVARFSSTVRLDGQLRDGDNNFGSSGQVLSSDGTDTRWVSSGSLAAGAASQVGINDDGNTNAERFITFVDSSSGNNSLKTDSVIKYNPSTNILNLNATASGIKFGPGNALNDDAHIEWLGGNNAGHLRISTSDDSGTEYIQFGDYDFQNRGGTFTQWLRISRNTGTFTGTFSATTFSGSGASLTSLNASNISSGTISAARVPTLNQNTTGSAATLTTARTIGGVSFNGSADINLPGVNQAGDQNTSGNAATATVLATARNFSISGEITANAQSFNGSGNVTLSATVDNNVIDEANLKISNSPTNGRFLQCNTGVSGGLTWAEVTVPAANTLSGTTLASGITASSITSLGTLTGLTVNGTVDINDTITLDSKNESPEHDHGVIIIQPSTSGGSTGINFRSKVNSTSDHGYLWWYDDNNNYAVNSSTTENGALVIGIMNDGNASTEDAVAIESSGDIFLNPGLTHGNEGGGAGPDFSKGRVYIGRASTKHEVWHEGNDGPSSGLNADKLDDQHGSYYRNAGNLNAGTIPDARLSTSSLFVTGMIILWSGASNAIPSGWVLCNGSNNTPDLRNRFVIGAGSGASYSPGDTGGSSSILLGTANLPAHTHQLGGSVGNTNLGNHKHSFSGSANTNNQGSHSHTVTFAQDDDQDADVPFPSRATPFQTTNSSSHMSSNGGHTHSVSISGDTGNKNLGNHNHSLPATTGNQGGAMGQAYNHLPPYYALCYIMKT